MVEHSEEKGIIKFSAGLLRRYPMRACVILVSFMAAGVMEGLSAGMLLPLLGKMDKGATDAISGGQGQAVLRFFDKFFSFLHIEQGIGSLLIFIIVLFSAKALLQYLAMREVGNATATMTTELRQSLIGSLMSARWSHFTSLPTGQIINALISEADRAALSYLHLCKTIADIIIVFVYLVAALFISWKVTLAAVAGSFLLMFALYRLVSVVKMAGKRQTEHMRSLSGLISDALVSFKSIKAMGRVNYFHELLSRDTQSLWLAKKKEVMGTELMASARDPLLVSLVAAGLYISYEYAGLALSTMLVLAFMFLRVVQKLTLIQLGYQRVVSQESAYWSIMETIEKADAAREINTGRRKPALSKEIKLDRVVFSYKRAGNERQVLENVSCVFPANKLSAIIGPSGSGKTTLIDIILGFYAPSSGRVTIDGESLEEVDIEAWRQMIGYIPQEGFLLHDTILSNVTLGDDMPLDVVEKALEQAGILEFVKNLPEGLNTVAGERGLLFSGGQRQRIGLARSLARRPALLLLDEPTSALDKDTEMLLLNTLKDLSKTMTIIVISHSERVKSYADNVYILDKGRLAA